MTTHPAAAARSRRPAIAATLLAVCFGGAAAPSPAAAQAPIPTESAAAMAAELEGLPWGSTCAAWSDPVDGASCEAFQGGGHWTRLEDQWCHRGAGPGVVGTPLFHALPYEGADPGPPRCTLEQYRAVLGIGGEAAGRAHAELARRLDALLGPSTDSGEVREFGSAYWEEVRRWVTDSLDVLLYRRPADEWNPPEIGLIARRRGLLDAMARDEAARWRSWTNPHAAAAAEVLRLRAPDLAGWVAGTEGVEGPARPAAMDALTRLLADAERADGASRAALLFAGDHLAVRIASSIDPAPVRDTTSPAPWGMTEPAVEALRSLELEVGWTPLGWAWIYERNLLRRLREEHPDTPWGERAAVLLIRSGWDTSGVCAAGPDMFRAVIEHGEEFLTARPDSPFRHEVVLALAEAYETWFSVSRAVRGDTYVMDPGEYAEGADDARLRAIELYRELMGTGGRGGWLAARQLPRLELGVDTNQRAYYCVYD